ncbi:hypothetical protein M5J20_08565 [Corynebacterium sp. TA-R-1]|uniref:Transmembrane protein n=1 Tax=Corynebacterium stercoris TaxID=2943490 RepID=A0ABT1G2I6_9CORY|nr:hypothetical protein [Corynebacterium stercoris]MCP1388234.1 hypothetical protein [Corynebacterium stercoris]
MKKITTAALAAALVSTAFVVPASAEEALELPTNAVAASKQKATQEQVRELEQELDRIYEELDRIRKPFVDKQEALLAAVKRLEQAKAAGDEAAQRDAWAGIREKGAARHAEAEKLFGTGALEKLLDEAAEKQSELDAIALASEFKPILKHDPAYIELIVKSLDEAARARKAEGSEGEGSVSEGSETSETPSTDQPATKPVFYPELSAGKIVGIVVGVIAAVAALVGLASFALPGFLPTFGR